MSRHRRLYALLALLLSFSLVAAACGDDGGSADPAPEIDPDELESGEVVVASDQEPRGWNPNHAAHNLFALGMLTELVYPQVFRITPELEVEVDETFMVRAEMTSEDPQVLEYEIREEAVWSDGTSITAQDFITQWELMNGTNPDVATVSTTGYDRIESIEPDDGNDKSFTITFSEPFADWTALWSGSTPLLPAHVLEERGDGDPVAGFNDGFSGEAIPDISGGPFTFANYQPEQSINLVPNEEYWGDQPVLERIVVRYDVPDEGIPTALTNEEIDMAYPQPQIDLHQQLEQLEGVTLESTIGLLYEHIDFNLRNEHLARLEVRQAIAHALDRDDIVRRTVGQVNPDVERLDNRIWLNPQAEYAAHGDEYQERDLERAQELLEQAGYERNGDFYEIDGERLTLRISTTGGNALRETTQRVIQNQLAEAGIEVTIDNLEGGAVFEKFFPESDALEDQDFDIALFAWVGNPWPSSQRALFTVPTEGSVGNNPMGYDSAQVDELFDEAISETDQDRVTELTNQIDQVLWEDLPQIPLYAKPTVLPFRDSIANVVDNPSTAGPMWNAQSWGFR